jgi:predicted DNA-binding ribbon-helix-helix protein
MIRKRSIAIRGHRTSLSVEDPFWRALAAIAGQRGLSLAALIAEIDDARRPEDNLSSAARLYVLEWLTSGKTLQPT